jgi:allantoinase
VTTFTLRSQRVFHQQRFAPLSVVVRNGVIVEIASFDSYPDASIVSGCLLPGLVDSHVHINEPGRTEWEGFETGTQAAARGGVTTLVDMPLNCIPVTTTAEALEVKRRAVERSLHVDVGLWGGVVPGNAHELASMAALGMLGAKCFLCHSGIDDFPASRRDDLLAAMPALRDAGVPLLVHAELELPGVPECAGDVQAYSTYLASRPREMEDRAIELMIELCRQTGCAVHIVHLSSASALPAIRNAKSEGLPFTVETCPHYLCLEAEEVARGATEWKCAPPIREHDNRELLWEAVRDGTIDLIPSDHSPCTPHLKLPDEGDFGGAWGGIASLSLGLPSVWAEASRRGVPLEQIVSRMSEAPSKLAGQWGKKGAIEVGFDADLVRFEPDTMWTVEPSDLAFRHRISPYLGRTLRGRIEETWLRGERIFARGVSRPPSKTPNRSHMGSPR